MASPEKYGPGARKRPADTSPWTRGGRRESPEALRRTLTMKFNNAAVYKKCPLPNRSSIRIFKLWPNADRDSMVEGSLVTLDVVSLGQTVEDDASADSKALGEDEAGDLHNPFTGVGYEAVSYTWGTDEPSREIRIFIHDRAFAFPVTSNLEAALKHFRGWQEEGQRRLWIDAICIDQQNNDERNVQVALMSTIFKEAHNVCVWLGPATDRSALAFRLMNHLVDLSDFDELLQDIGELELLDEFSKLMSRAWFGRRWVVQEIGLAKRATIHCGDQVEDWDKFANAVSLFKDAEITNQSISKLFRESRDYHFRSDSLGEVRFIGAIRLVDATSRLFRKSGDGKILEHLLPLETLVAQLTTFQSSDRRDTIYSILSLAKDTQSSLDLEQTPEAKAYRALFEKLSKQAQQKLMLLSRISQRRLFTVDYRKKFFEVCKDFLEFAITGSRSLDILCRPWAPPAEDYSNKDQEILPSWIPILTSAAFGKRPDGRYIRTNADPLVGDPITARRNYNAAMDTKAYSIEFGRDSNSRSLFVSGTKIDEVSKLQGEALGGNIPYAWLRFGGWTDRTADPPEEFWRTLVADRGSNGENPPVYYNLACKYAFHQGPREAALNPEQIIRSGVSSIGIEFLRRMQEVVWSKRLMRTHEFKRLGLVPGGAEEGDWICILYGCSVPVILRPTGPVQGELPPFEFIGECYMHGMMDGEVFDLRLNQRGKKRFELI